MKRLIILTSFIFISSVCLAQGWGSSVKEKTSNFFDRGNSTQVIVNEDDKKTEKANSNGLSGKESTYNIDVELFPFIMPDQPAADQMIQTFTGFGMTYKFSDKMHVVGKWMKFDIKGANDVKWAHDHKLIGIGLRDTFAQNQIIQLNILTGESSVTGDHGIGKVANLEPPVFFDIKYLWMFGESLIVGPQITFGRVASSCKDPDGRYTECGHGGYTSFGLTVQIGIPDDMVSQ